MSIAGLFQWLGHRSMGLTIRRSTWGAAIVEMIHLLAFAALGSLVLIVDLRLLGIGLQRQPPSRLEKKLAPIFLGSLAVILVSDVLILSTEPMKCYHSSAFRARRLLLLVALLFHFTLHSKAVKSTPHRIQAIWTRSAAALSLALWLAVGLAVRAIGFL
jgi:hypothetical protein